MRILIITIISACQAPEKSIDTDNTNILVLEDLDGDGYDNTEDCQDENVLVNPNAEEICDGIDNNCDGQIDEDVLIPFYADSDGDGFGNPDIINESCSIPDGYAQNGTDCDDGNNQSYPGAEERCDGEDNNCNDEVDENLNIDFYVDNDGDGFGDDNNIISGCQAEMGLATIGGDCDDNNVAISPVAIEVCDELDNNCNDDIDEEVQTTYYLDFDTDGFGDASNTLMACTPEEGFVLNGDDCNDADTQAYPNAVEFCDNIDNNCDGTVDEDSAIDGTLWFADFDNDGFGTPNSTYSACTQPTNYEANNLDCNDSDDDVNPNANELCNTEDDNCDGIIDEDSAIDASTWYRDADEDGFGSPIETIASCNTPSGYTADNTDCDDYDNDTNPNANETCNGEDDNCDGTIDEDSAIDANTWYQDADEDGFGDNTTTSNACAAPSGFVADNMDCNDGNTDINPSASEICNEEDDDCNGVNDDFAVDALVFYEDADEDTYGNLSIFSIACEAPIGYTNNAGDCDDANTDINPGMDELCNEIDDNCDEDIDTNAIDAQFWFEDLDEDSYGTSNVILSSCAQPTGYVDNAGDCEDSSADINPDALELCNEIDDNCNGYINEGVLGDDSDCPAESCANLLAQEPTSNDGAYWIDPDGNGAIETYCNMSVADGGWTLVAKFTNQDARNWANAVDSWIDTSTFGSTNDLSDGNDAKSPLWSRMSATNFMLNDHLFPTDYVYTDDDCIGGVDLSSYFGTALASFPYTDANYYDVCAVQFSYIPSWATEPDWSNQTASSSQIGLNASSTIAIAKTDNGGDTSGVISFYEASDAFEADVGLGALENGQTFTNNGYSQDIGGPTSCGYDDSECAAEYPETVFFWIR
jgi:hypothetical protein